MIENIHRFGRIDTADYNNFSAYLIKLTAKQKQPQYENLAKSFETQNFNKQEQVNQK